jgi:GH43 family beta-xylosidase
LKTFTSGDKVEIWSSPNLLELGRSAQRQTVWRPPPNTHYSGGIWAPELHALDGRWYIYVAAEDPKHGNKSHRMYVLGGPEANSDPSAGQWEFLGPIAGMPDHWAIDGTILPLNGKNYFIYSGWPFHNPNMSDLIQELFIIELAAPTRACSQAVSISQPVEPWERTENHGINEGPQALIHPDGRSWAGIAYSCAGSWTKDYKVNTLRYNGGDPLHPSSWQKARYPLLQGRLRGGAPFGPGHGSFLNVGGDTVTIYHATDRPDDGWNNRKARIQRVMWTQDGPWMGEVGPLVDTVQHYLAPPVGIVGVPGGKEPQHDFKVDVDKYLNKAMGFLKKF